MKKISALYILKLLIEVFYQHAVGSFYLNLIIYGLDFFLFYLIDLT